MGRIREEVRKGIEERLRWKKECKQREKEYLYIRIGGDNEQEENRNRIKEGLGNCE